MGLCSRRRSSSGLRSPSEPTSSGRRSGSSSPGSGPTAISRSGLPCYPAFDRYLNAYGSAHSTPVGRVTNTCSISSRCNRAGASLPSTWRTLEDGSLHRGDRSGEALEAERVGVDRVDPSVNDELRRQELGRRSMHEPSSSETGGQ